MIFHVSAQAFIKHFNMKKISFFSLCCFLFVSFGLYAHESPSIAISGSDVYAGGNFTDAGGNSTADRIARWEAAPLPVAWVSLEARQQAQAVQLDWVVANQSKNAGWQVEHSTDGTTWARIGWVKGDGTVQELKKYSFLHPAKDLLHIVLDDESENATADIINMSGQHVRTVSLEKGQHTLSVGDLIPGEYVLSVATDAGVTTLRFTVVK